MTPRRARPASALAVLVMVLVVVAPACGITDDPAPRALGVTTSTTEPPATPTSGSVQATVWLVREGNLVPVTTSLPDTDPATVLGALLEGPDAAQGARGLSSSIPTGTELRGVEATDGTLAVDLSRAFDDVVGPAKQQAIAQIVMTATESPDVSATRFQVAGRAIPVASPARGDAETVDDCDFASLLPTELAARDLGLTPPTLELLRERRTALARDCPTVTGG